jgi:hypothetical protein
MKLCGIPLNADHHIRLRLEVTLAIHEQHVLDQAVVMEPVFAQASLLTPSDAVKDRGIRLREADCARITHNPEAILNSGPGFTFSRAVGKSPPHETR